MKAILVPIDFSKGAHNALNYACALAKKENAKIILLNAYHLSYLPGHSDQVVFQDPEEAKSNTNQKLRALCENITKTKKVKCEYIIKYSLAVDGILDTIRKKRPDLVIMGTKGASGVKEIFMGSNTATVIEKAKCPVIAVPENSTYEGINKITYATDYRASDIPALKQITKIAKPFKADVLVLHASDEELTHDTENALLLKFKKNVHKKISYPKMKFKLEHGKYLEKVLQDHMKQEKPDVLAMSTRYRGIMEKITGSSVTKKLAYHSQVPLLVFHHKHDSVVFL